MSDLAIFLDMDGVLADFTGAVIKLFGDDQQKVLDEWPKGLYHHYFGHSKHAFYAALNKAGEDFWIGLDELPGAAELYVRCASIAPTYFCSAPTVDPSSASGKIYWLRNFTGNATPSYIFTQSKELLAKPGRLLIDDRDQNCDRFKEAGGEAIVFPRLWNSRYELANRASSIVNQELRQWQVFWSRNAPITVTMEPTE